MKLTIISILVLLFVFGADGHRGGGGWGRGGGWGGRGGWGRGFGGWGLGGWGLGGWGMGFGGWGMGLGGWGFGGPMGPWGLWGPRNFLFRRAAVEPKPRVECNYFNSTQRLACVASNTNKTESCETISVLEKFASKSFFNFYAIAALPRGDLSKPEQVVFSIFPEMLEERGWLNSTFVDPISKLPVSYSIYSGEQSVSNGFRVRDPVCYARLVSLLTGFGFNETIVVGSDSNAFKQVDVLGGILMGF